MHYLLTSEEYAALVPRQELDEARVMLTQKTRCLDALWEAVLEQAPDPIRRLICQAYMAKWDVKGRGRAMGEGRDA